MSQIDEGRRVLKIEAQAILDVAERLGPEFDKAVQMVLDCKGKIIFTGIGKSGHIARKIASTMSSTGTPAIFLHPAESSHGDMGLIDVNDLVIGISNGGEAIELVPILNFVARRGQKMIAFTGQEESTLAKAADVVLNISVKEEACPLGLAPTSSSTVTLALGDALAMAILNAKGFKKEDYAEVHPGGSLGRRLLTRVKDVMHLRESLPLVDLEEKMTTVISLMTSKDVRGVAGVIDSQGHLVGIITDGDIRRRLEKTNTSFTESAKDIMSRNPKTIDLNEQAAKALFVMEQFKIQTLFAIDKSSNEPTRPVGILHLQDLLQAKVR